MDVVYLSMLVVVCLIAIGMTSGPGAIYYWVGSLKSKLTRSRKTKTDHTA